MGVNRKRLGRGEGLTERRLPSMAAGRGVWGASSFWTNQKGSKGLLTLCPRKYICNKRPLLPEVRLREARPPGFLSSGLCLLCARPSLAAERRRRASPRSLPRRVLAANSHGACARRCTMLSLPGCSHFWSHLYCK